MCTTTTTNINNSYYYNSNNSVSILEPKLVLANHTQINTQHLRAKVSFSNCHDVYLCHHISLEAKFALAKDSL